jgi:hypothetical protein
MAPRRDDSGRAAWYSQAHSQKQLDILGLSRHPWYGWRTARPIDDTPPLPADSKRVHICQLFHGLNSVWRRLSSQTEAGGERVPGAGTWEFGVSARSMCVNPLGEPRRRPKRPFQATRASGG